MKIRNKIDLHLHIDGSVRPETVYELSRIYGIEPECGRSLEEIRASMTIPDGEFDPDFLTFEPPLRVMQKPEALTRITRELVERLEEEGLIYAELRFAPQYHTNGGMTQEEAVIAAIHGLEEGLAGCHTLKAGLILCAMNHCDPASNRAENFETLRLAKKYLGGGSAVWILRVMRSGCRNTESCFPWLISRGFPPPPTASLLWGRPLPTVQAASATGIRRRCFRN